jgi:SAM-dependent methyltransferase
VGNGGCALDLGSGAFNDARFLIEKGYEVDAVDSHGQVPDLPLHFYPVAFKDFNFPKGKYDLVNAQFALPFNGEEGFRDLIQNIYDSLKPDGVFVGQLFGTEDSWYGDKNIAFHTIQEVLDLFAPFKIAISEEKKEGGTASGKNKFWHVFHIKATKPNDVYQHSSS